MDRDLIPVACTLPAAGAVAQAAEWAELAAEATAVERIDGGAAMTFATTLEARAKDLAEREASCCAFLTITTKRTEQGFRVAITSPDPEALSIIESLAGLSGQ